MIQVRKKIFRLRYSVLSRQEIPFETGNNSEKILEYDIIIVSPGVPLKAAVIQKARSMKKKILGEIEVASWICKGPIVAISGSNGKTTTTTLTGRMFYDARVQHFVAGNIGKAFSSCVSESNEETTSILEISSFQLDTIDTFHPKIAVLLNITPDHLDRYDHKFENYIASKSRIFMNQTMEDVLIYCDDDPVTKEIVETKAINKVRLLPFSILHEVGEGAFVSANNMIVRIGEKDYNIIPIEQISVKGDHNIYNAMAATLVSMVCKISQASIRATLKNFKGVEHRLEFVRDLDGIRYINDSKATNVDAVWYALRSFNEPLVVLLGGRDKGNDYRRLFEPVREHVRAIIAIGESSEKVADNFKGYVPVEKADTMEHAVNIARTQAKPGDVVLLSPACASFDWFNNYEHRGRVFKDIVLRLK